jgi:hypothetical protein
MIACPSDQSQESCVDGVIGLNKRSFLEQWIPIVVKTAPQGVCSQVQIDGQLV